MGKQQGADWCGHDGAQAIVFAGLGFHALANGKAAHERGKAVPNEHRHAKQQHKYGVQQLAAGEVGGGNHQPPHHAHGNHREDDGIDQLVHKPVSQMRQGCIGSIAGGKPAIHQVKGHGNKKETDAQGIDRRIAAPHHRHRTDHAPKDQKGAAVDQYGRQFGRYLGGGRHGGATVGLLESVQIERPIGFCRHPVCGNIEGLTARCQGSAVQPHGNCMHRQPALACMPR